MVDLSPNPLRLQFRSNPVAIIDKGDHQVVCRGRHLGEKIKSIELSSVEIDQLSSSFHKAICLF